MPSMASALVISSSTTSFGAVTASTVSAMPCVCSISFSDNRTDVGDASENLGRQLAGGGQRLTLGSHPVDDTELPGLFCAPMRRPVRISSLATFGGMDRGSRITPPAPAIRPTLTSLSANFADSSATTRWQANAISKPPPMANPLTAAITGLCMFRRLVRPAKPLSGTYIGLPLAL